MFLLLSSLSLETGEERKGPFPSRGQSGSLRCLIFPNFMVTIHNTLEHVILQAQTRACKTYFQGTPSTADFLYLVVDTLVDVNVAVVNEATACVDRTEEFVFNIVEHDSHISLLKVSLYPHQSLSRGLTH